MWNPNPFFGGYQQPVRAQVPQVNGEGGAKAYSLAPNSSILLLDTTAPIVWHKRTKYSTVVSTTPTGGTFKLLGNPPCAPNNDLTGLTGGAVATVAEAAKK